MSFFLLFSVLFEAHFLKHYKYLFLGFNFREENTIPRVSHLCFLNQLRVSIFEHFTLDLERILKFQSARGLTS